VSDQTKRLVRRSASGRIAGVCAGIAEYLDTDVTLVRLAWIVLTIVPGAFFGGIIAYVAAWIVMPDAPGVPASVNPAGRHLTRSLANRKIGGVCGGIADYLNVDATAVRVAWAILSVVPGCVIFGALAYAVAWLIMPDPTSATTHAVPTAA